MIQSRKTGKNIYEPTGAVDKVCDICKNVGKVTMGSSVVPTYQIIENANISQRGVRRVL